MKQGRWDQNDSFRTLNFACIGTCQIVSTGASYRWLFLRITVRWLDRNSIKIIAHNKCARAANYFLKPVTLPE